MAQVDPYQKRALLLGHEESLLLSRKWLLLSAGCECVTVRSVSKYREMLLSRTFGLVILCQTITFEECSSAIAFAAEYDPQAQVLVMFSRDGRCEAAHDNVLLDATAGPGIFLQTTERMLNSARRVAMVL